MEQRTLSGTGTLVWLTALLHEVQTILVAFPFVSFMIVGTGGAFAAGAFAIEHGTHSTGFASRLARALFVCGLLWALWDYGKWPMPLGLMIAGIVSVYPQQALDWAKEKIRVIAEARLGGGGKGKP